LHTQLGLTLACGLALDLDGLSHARTGRRRHLRRSARGRLRRPLRRRERLARRRRLGLGLVGFGFTRLRRRCMARRRRLGPLQLTSGELEEGLFARGGG
jgi:hypothetical protein